MSDQNTTYVTTGLDRLIDQFQHSTQLRSLASAFLQRAQDFEDAVFPLFAERGLSNATGDRLDILGQLVAKPRAGRSDADYRLALAAEFRILRSVGTAEDLLEVAQAVVQMGTADFELVEYAPKTVYVRPVNHVLLQDPVFVGTSMTRTAAAATELLFVYSWVLDAATFQFSSTTSSQTDADTGFGAIPTYILNWGYDGTSTELSGLASGDFRINSAAFMEATEMYVHDSPDSGGDQSAQLAALLNSHLRIAGASGQFYVMIDDFTDNGGTFTFEIRPSLYVGSLSNGDLTSFYHYTSGGHLAGVAPE